MANSALQTTYPYQPDYAIPPGETLRDTLEALDMPQAELARRTGLSIKHINQIVQGAAPITPETALALERVTGVPAQLWARLEANYQAREARRRERLALDPSLSWLDLLPIRDLVSRGYLRRTQDRIALLQDVLTFFGVASASAWMDVWMAPDAAFRTSPAFSCDPYAVACWLRIGEIEAAKIECQPFDRARFVAALRRIRSLMGANPDAFEPELIEQCRQSGVAIVFVAETKGARASGAARWLSPTKALIQLSLRYRWADHFWFTFFHEAGHLLLHGKREAFLDDDRDDRDVRERQADTFAARTLIPVEYEPQLANLTALAAIRSFADSIGVPPGIVVGRLQREHVIPFNVGNHLRVQYQLRDDVRG